MKRLLPSVSLEVVFIAAVLILSVVLRVVFLSSVPSGFHNDEASFFINALALAKTGLDEDGNPYPFILNSFIDPKPALFSYLQIPFIAIAGETILAARLPSVLFGAASLIASYFLIKKIFGNQIALLSLVLLSISPWHIVVSRGTQEVIASFFFTVTSLLLSYELIHKKKTSTLLIVILSGTAFLSMYLYHSAKVFLPLAVVVLSLSVSTPKKIITRVAPMSLVVILVMALTSSSLFGGLTRFQAISIFNEKGTQLEFEEQVRDATGVLPTIVLRVLHNKFLAQAFSISRNYFSFFTADFLFLKGGQPARLIVPFNGLFFPVLLLALVIGIVRVIRDGYTREEHAFIWGILLIAPIASSITSQENPSMIRTFPMILPLTVLMAIGLQWAITHRHMATKTLLYSVFLIGFTIGFVHFTNQYVVQQPRHHNWERNVADQKMAKRLVSVEKQYESIKITQSVSGQPYVYLVLERLIPIVQLQRSFPARFQQNFKIGKYHFTSDKCPTGGPRTLVFAHHGCMIPKGFVGVDTIGHDQYDNAYLLYRHDPTQISTKSAKQKRDREIK